MSHLADKLVAKLLALNAILGATLRFEPNAAFFMRLFGYRVGPGTILCAEAMDRSAEVGKSVRVGHHVRLGRNVTIGDGVILRLEAFLRENVQVGEYCVVGEAARLENITIGDGSMIELEVVCLGHGNGRITVGRQCYIGLRNVLDWSDNIVIGDFVHLAGPSTAIWTHSSAYQALHGDGLNNKARRTTAPVYIESNVYIGGNCTIYPGVTIGHHSIVLPNSAVSADVPMGAMVGGVPARVIRELDIDR